jgi:dTDP-4-dehydrorhamnose 3,5-epimerase
MNYKNNNWDHVDVSYLKTFNLEVPVFTPSIYREYRGEIFTTYHNKTHPVTGFIPSNTNAIHSRFSKSYKNVLRGLHYDDKTWKLVQALLGDIYLVIADVRLESPTYGKWESYIISEKTRDQILVPPGFANGHYALTDCVFHYNLFYDGEYNDVNKQKVLKWNDTSFNITWPTDSPILGDRDNI